MDWGLGNPNKTAALIATLAVAVWSLAYVRSWLFWVSLVGFSVLGVCLVHTFSRGGLVAAFCGLVPLLIALHRPWAWTRIVAVVIAVWVIIGASIFLQAHERFGQGIAQEDRSISNRFVLWKAAPTMMVDAPSGWGLGESGKAYTDWYQPLDRNESYRTLVNSHLTWLVEFGWLGRFAYLAAWIAVFVICFPSRNAPWLSIPFGIWVSFFVGAFFSSVAESPWLWIVPTAALLWVVVWRARTRVFPERKWLLLPLPTALVLCLAIATFAPRSAFHREGSSLVVGPTPPKRWIVIDKKVLGNSFPRPLRTALAKNSALSCALVANIDDLPASGVSDLIIAGTIQGKPISSEKLKSLESITLVNPTFPPISLPLAKETTLRVIIGEFAQSASASDWESIAKVENLPGVGDFVPNWPDVLLGGKKEPNGT